MSIYGLPRTEMYWGNETRISQVAGVMSRNRWQAIKTNIHLNDNSTSDQTTDKLIKLRPFLYSLSNNLQKIPIGEKVCVDEQIIPFKGRHSLKVYVKNKPKKWGYKVFALCDCSGVLPNFEIYTSSKDLAWDGPKLNSFFSFISVGVAVEVWLHPCVGDRFPCVDDVYDSRA